MRTYFTRRSALTIIAGGATLAAGRARAEAMSGRDIYPVAIPVYQSHFIADRIGFYKEAGLDCKLIQGGSGVKTREIIASSQGDIGIGDITHPMQLSNHGRAGRVVMPVDSRSNAVYFIIRKDLMDQGINTLEKFAAWKRPDGRKPIVSVSSLGGTNHVWASYYMEKMGLDDKVTWIGTGNVDTMMGTLKTKQADILVNSLSVLNDSTAQGWGALIFDGTDEAIWNKYIGGKVPVTSHFTLQSTIDKDPAKMQAFVTALWRATQWIKKHSPAEIYDAIEPYVGSTSKDGNIAEIASIQKVTDYDCVVDDASFARGEKVWFREMTGIKPLAKAEIINTTFIEAARKAYPGLTVQDMSAAQLDRSLDVKRIDVRDLSKTFQLKGVGIEAVRDVSFGVRRGEFVALLGPSGSGKSTVLNMIATLIKPSSGQILIDGKPVETGKATPNVGYVFQRDTLFPWRTVADNIGYELELAGVPDRERKERIAACVGQAGLKGFEDAYPSALSGGMRQRAALMRTLVVEPQVLLMDEPFGALDTHTKIDMHEVLLRIWEREKQTVLFVTHDLGEALTLADRIILFSARPGRIKDMFEVDFARPRDAVKVRETPRYAELFQHIWHSLGEEFVKGRSI